MNNLKISPTPLIQKNSKRHLSEEELTKNHFKEESSNNFAEVNSNHPENKISSDHSKKKYNSSKNHTEKTSVKNNERTFEEKYVIQPQKNHNHQEKVQTQKPVENYSQDKILTFHTEPYSPHPPHHREKSSNDIIKAETPNNSQPEQFSHKTREKDTFLVPMPLKKMNPKNPPNKPLSSQKKSPIPDQPQIPETISLKKEKTPLDVSLSALPIKKISTEEPSHKHPTMTTHSIPLHAETTVIPPSHSRIPEKRKLPQSPAPSPQKKAKSYTHDNATERFIERVRREQQTASLKLSDKRKQRGVKRHRD